ncbi:EAL domain-containing protein [Marinomonas fungiae]|uniref:EAL domain-containing protein n=1 Tax=Marinomonas fungiae TaxID=1137284 RepID=UPI003A94A79B
MNTTDSDCETDWKSLQETKRCFIVLDSNHSVVFCNELLNATYSPFLKRYLPPSNCLWLESEQRYFYFSEFHKKVGEEIDLIFTDNNHNSTHLKLWVEPLEVSNEQYLNVKLIDQIPTSQKNGSLSSDTLIQELVHDVYSGKLSVHYQPQINISNNGLYGVEALTRWHKDEGTLISPDVFIPLAEKYHFIAELDLWIFDHVCQQLTKWESKGIEVPITSVNFSPMSFNDIKTHERILNILKQNNISPDRITIEVTESNKITCCSLVIDGINNLHSTGIKISLDDFGIGHSNFSRIAKIPVSQIKLDRSFVLNLPGKIYTEISVSTLSIGQNLGLSVVAEGVENIDQLEMLRRMGYQIFQGYFFSKPLPEVEFEQWFFDKIKNHCSQNND